jgi:hypothetical protein
MRRLLRYLPPLVILLPLLFVCGKLVFTSVAEKTSGLYSEVGWPWVYSQFGTTPGASGGTFLVWRLLADVAVCLAAVGVVGLLLFIWYRRTSGRWQVSIRGILVTTLIVGLVVAWAMQHGKPWERQERCLKAWKAKGISLTNFVDLPPEWARRLFPPSMMDIFRRGTALSDANCTESNHAAAVEAAFEALGDLPDVHEIEFTRCHEPVAIRNPEALRHIRSIRCWADDETLRAFSGAPNLHTLAVYGPMTDQGLEVLKNCSSLTSLDIISNRVTDAGMGTILDLPRLTSLNIYGCPQISAETVNLLKAKIPTVRAHSTAPTKLNY